MQWRYYYFNFIGIFKVTFNFCCFSFIKKLKNSIIKKIKTLLDLIPYLFLSSGNSTTNTEEVRLLHTKHVFELFSLSL